jgi:hypothetical protein
MGETEINQFLTDLAVNNGKCQMLNGKWKMI